LKNYKEYLLSLFIIILVGFGIYSNSFNCSFHFDDIPDIIENQSIKDLSNIKAWWNYCPRRAVGMFTFALNYHFHQLGVFGYHLVNWIIHLIAGIIVWWLVRLTLTTPALQNYSIRKQRFWFPLCVGLLFVVHPIQTQAVTYIVQRLASLATMFYLLSLTLFVKGRLWNGKAFYRILLWIGAFISAALGMLTKEIVFTLPFSILLYEYTFLKTKSWKFSFKNKKHMLGGIFFVLIILIIPLLFLSKQSFSALFTSQEPQQGHLYDLTVGKYLMTQFRVIVTYIRLMFLPIRQNLDYDYPVATHFFTPATFFSFSFLIIILIGAFFLFRKNRLMAFGIFFFFLTLSVESSVIVIQNVIFEHRLYLPSVGFVLFLTSALFYFYEKRNSQIAIGVMVFIIGAHSILTYQRNKVWQDESTLWTDIIKKSPHKARPWASRSKVYFMKGEYDNALADLNKALAINPNYLDALNNRGLVYLEMKKYDEALTDFNDALKINPDFLLVKNNRGIVYRERGEYEKAITEFNQMINANPNFLSVYNNRGAVYLKLKAYSYALSDFNHVINNNPEYMDAYFNRGTVYYELENNEKAIADFNTIINSKPDYYQAYYSRGLVYFQQKNYQFAIADFDHAIKNIPNFTDALLKKGIALKETGEYDKAMQTLNQFISAEPNNIIALYQRGELFLMLKDLQNAYNYLNNVLSMDVSNALALKNRGYIYALLKDYPKALDDFSKAIELDPKYLEAYNNRGNTFVVLKEYNKAIKDYSSALAIDPGYSNALYNRSLCYYQLRKFKDAAIDLEQCRQLGARINDKYALELKNLILYEKK
jgi:protein O-mannosyl-transferase